jgi:Heterokaryon incompatibility protein (HET)
LAFIFRYSLHCDSLVLKAMGDPNVAMGDLNVAMEPSCSGHITPDPLDKLGTLQEYIYPALPDGKSIRMLLLGPGKEDDPLKGIIEFANIDSPDSYEPLSYVWGPPQFIHQISIEVENSERAIKLTPSLYGALKRLRLPDRARRLWADQICIDQSSISERGQQVQFMNRIYKHASHVLVWLGPDDKGLAKPAFARIHKLYKTFKNATEREIFKIAHIRDLEHQSRDDWDTLDHLTDLPWVS